MENNLLAEMTSTLTATNDLSGLNAESVFKCLDQVIEGDNSQLWSKLRCKISNKLESVLYKEIVELMKDVQTGWAIKIDTESSYDDQGSYFTYADDPYLNNDIFPINMSGESTYCGNEMEEEWLPIYPSLTVDVLEVLVNKLDLLFDEMSQGFTLTKNELRRA